MTTRWERLADRVYSAIERGAKLVVVYAPTSYGKTMASPLLLKKLRERGLASRLIHVVPTRALLRQIYLEKFARFEESGLRVAYQSHDVLPGALKSPYYLSDLTVTTLDSFLLNAYKLQPSELSKLVDGLSEGHYYPALTALSTSVVVFDEAHLYIADTGVREAAKLTVSAASALIKMEITCLIVTATLPTVLLNNIARSINIKSSTRVVYVCPEGALCTQLDKIQKQGFCVDVLDVDSSWATPRWTTRFLSRGDALAEARRRCRDELVLYVSNTVDGALQAYRELSGECRTALVHARLSEADREKAEDRISKLREERSGVIVGSPVIEVGVDVDADILITEPAPLENLAQRAGRLCRKACRDAEVVIIDDIGQPATYDQDLVSRAVSVIKEESGVEWRLFWKTESGRSYVDLLEEVADSCKGHYGVQKIDVFEKIVLEDARPRDYLEQLAREFRGLSLLKIAVKYDTLADLEDRNYVLSDTSLLQRLYEKSCLEVCESGENSAGVSVLAVVESRERKPEIARFCSKRLADVAGGRDEAAWIVRVRAEIRKIVDREGNWRRLLDFFVIARRECYKEGLGLGAEL